MDLVVACLAQIFGLVVGLDQIVMAYHQNEDLLAAAAGDPVQKLNLMIRHLPKDLAAAAAADDPVQIWKLDSVHS